MSLTLLWQLSDLQHWGQGRDEAGTGVHVPPQPRPCCATTLGPAGSSCLSSEFLSGGNRQVNIPDRLIRTWCEATGLASQLYPWILHRSTRKVTSVPVEHHWVRREVGMLTLGPGDTAKVPSGTSKMHPKLAHPTTVRHHHGTEHLLLIAVVWDGALL